MLLDHAEQTVMRHRVAVLVGSLLVAAGLAVACNQTPSDLREWRPSDHDNTENAPANQQNLSDGGQTGVMGVDEVALATWRSKCVECHGLIGRGDGPRGASLRARDLTDPAWQASVTDEQLAASILKGKGQMPKNDFPESTVKSLVRLVRLLNASRAARPDDSEDTDTDTGDEDADAAPTDAAPRTSDAGAGKGKADAAAPRRDAGRPAAPRVDAGAY
jgi:hypothetical protein